MSRWTYVESAVCNGVVAIRDYHVIVGCDDPKNKDVVYSLTWQSKGPWTVGTSMIGQFNHLIIPIVMTYNYTNIGKQILNVQPLSGGTSTKKLSNGWVGSVSVASIIEMTNGIYDGSDFYMVSDGCVGRKKYLTRASRIVVLNAVKAFNEGLDDGNK